jgi:monovalent cation/hydrogen antiporter
MIQAAEIVLLTLLLFVVVFAALARKLQTPYPIVLVVAGLILGFVPGIPRIPLNPDVIFLLVLPPLLYSAAWLTSWREFKYNLVSVSDLQRNFCDSRAAGTHAASVDPGVGTG